MLGVGLGSNDLGETLVNILIEMFFFLLRNDV